MERQTHSLIVLGPDTSWPGEAETNPLQGAYNTISIIPLRLPACSSEFQMQGGEILPLTVEYHEAFKLPVLYNSTLTADVLVCLFVGNTKKSANKHILDLSAFSFHIVHPRSQWLSIGEGEKS